MEEVKKDNKFKVSSMLIELEKLFDLFNAHFWGGELEPCAIVIKVSETGREIGTHTNKRVWQAVNNSSEFFEISMSSDYLQRTKYQIAGTLLHEMVHHYNAQFGFKDCYKRQHTDEFRVEAERVLLQVTKVKGVGWGHTEESQELKKLVDTFDIDWEVFNFFYTRQVKAEAIRTPKPKYVYTNPDDEKEKLKYKKQIQVLDVETGKPWKEKYEDGVEE